MKNIVLLFGLILVVTACVGDAKRTTSLMENDIQPVKDSIAEVGDTLKDTIILVQDIIPVSADESFADFFFNFMTDEEYQRRRIVFPMPYYQGTEVKRIEKQDWQYDPIFSENETYTILFDSAEEMDIEKDTSLCSAQVDWIFLDQNSVKRYYFEKKNDQWILEAINVEELKTEEQGEDFFSFYDRFAVDTVFQSERLHDPLLFVTTDPEDDFNILETTLDRGQWFAFRPPMMEHRLTNIRYGQKRVQSSNTRIVEFKGVGNGLSNVLYFQRIEGKWILKKFEDLSD